MNDTPLWAIFVGSIVTSNILLAYFLGMCSFLVCSNKMNTAVGLGTAVTFVVTCTAALNYLIYHKVLVPMHLQFLQFLVFIVVIAAFVQLVEMFIERFSPALYFSLGIFLPLITVNCAILGASLFMILRKYNLLQSTCFGFSSGLGWTLAIVLMAGLRQKMGYANVPAPLRGLGIIMLVTGVMAMAFMGFAGMVASG